VALRPPPHVHVTIFFSKPKKIINIIYTNINKRKSINKAVATIEIRRDTEILNKLLNTLVAEKKARAKRIG
jgi:hypothetical protein